jgi:hypothetical protein
MGNLQCAFFCEFQVQNRKKKYRMSTMYYLSKDQIVTEKICNEKNCQKASINGLVCTAFTGCKQVFCQA